MVRTRGNGPLQFEGPRGITFNPTNNKVHVVDDNHRVQVLNSDLPSLICLGRVAVARGQFDEPYDIALEMCTYVAHSDNHRIQVFTAKGKFLRKFGRRGQGRGELHCMPYQYHNRH